MQPRIKMGLIVGVVGLVLNVCVLPDSSGSADHLHPCWLEDWQGSSPQIRKNKQPRPMEPEQEPSQAALRAPLMIIGQMIGGVIALVLMQTSGTQLPFGTIPTGDDPSMIGNFLSTGLGTGLCFAKSQRTRRPGQAQAQGILEHPISQQPLQPYKTYRIHKANV